MRKIVVYFCLLLVLPVGVSIRANEPDQQMVQANNAIAKAYSKLDFNGIEKLDYKVYEKAYVGYMNLKAAQKLNTQKHILTICDYSLSANKNRMWVIDMQNNKVLLNTYVAHGQGTGDEYAKAFSNKEGSHQSSIGFYVTGDTYQGSHGLSLYLHGMDEGYNSAAYERAIVMHGAGYVSKDFISGTGRLGRSWGCPAVAADVSAQLIDCTKDGTCLFAYYPEDKYLATSYWLNQELASHTDTLQAKPLYAEMLAKDTARK